MMTLQAIQDAIASLTPEQEAQIRDWLNNRSESEWDAQIEKDEASGRLDAFTDHALAQHRAGLTKRL